MNVTILGAGYGGLITALRLSRRARGQINVTLINPRDELIERIRLHERGAGRTAKRHSIPAMLEGTGVTFLEAHVDAVDLQTHMVHAGQHTIPFDELVVATGSRTDDRIDGVRAHALSLDGPGAERLAEAVLHSKTITVVGGGLTAIEMATELAEAHPSLEVSLVTRGLLAPEFSDKARAYFREAFTRLRITLHEHTAVERVEAKQLVTATATLPFDACVWTSGFLASPLPEGLTVRTNTRGQIVSSPTLESISHPGVWGVGDAVTSSLDFPMGCKSAQPSGAHVADNLINRLRGRALQPFDYRAPAYCVSIGRRDGLLQWTLADGTPHGSINTGRFIARVKELICRFTVWSFTLERRGLSNYGAFKANRLASQADQPDFPSP